MFEEEREVFPDAELFTYQTTIQNNPSIQHLANKVNHRPTIQEVEDRLVKITLDKLKFEAEVDYYKVLAYQAANKGQNPQPYQEKIFFYGYALLQIKIETRELERRLVFTNDQVTYNQLPGDKCPYVTKDIMRHEAVELSILLDDSEL